MLCIFLPEVLLKLVNFSPIFDRKFYVILSNILSSLTGEFYGHKKKERRNKSTEIKDGNNVKQQNLATKIPQSYQKL